MKKEKIESLEELAEEVKLNNKLFGGRGHERFNPDDILCLITALRETEESRDSWIGMYRVAQERAEKAEAALSSAKLEGVEERKAFICKNCEGVYADAPVSECDCTCNRDIGFYEGAIFYSKAAEEGQ